MPSQQLSLAFEARTWGGRRANSGRQVVRRGVQHRERADFAARHPLHITLQIVRDCPTLRCPSAIAAIHEVIAESHRSDFRIVHFTVMADHVHLIVEAGGQAALSEAMQGFKVRMAKRLNKLFDREGKLFGDP